jgi:DNA (cytosine-5)-methyltransferase 1
VKDRSALAQGSLFPTRAPELRVTFEDLLPGEDAVDNFAGAGGVSTGTIQAIGKPVTMALNHDPEVVRIHEVNHPETRHYCEDITTIDPRELCRGRKIGIAWFAPDCTHHSKAKGSKPRDSKSRGLAKVVVDWCKAVRPRIVMVENVEEFEDWGPLNDTGRPDRDRLGEFFRPWAAEISDAGYRVEWRLLVGADYGAPTTRKRFFLVARCDGRPIVWPEPTHGKGRAHAWRTAAEIIEWDKPTRSIFDRKRPLVEASLRRIFLGVDRFVINCAEPFIIPVTHPRDARLYSLHEPLRTVTAAKRGEFALVSPFIIRHGHTSNKTGAGIVAGPGMPGIFRGQPLSKPLGVITTRDDKNLVVPLFTKHYGGANGHQTPGSAASAPLGSVTSRDHHAVTAVELEHVEASFITKYYGTSIGSDMRTPLPTVTATGNHLAEVRAFLKRFHGDAAGPPPTGLVQIYGEHYQLADLGTRMLTPRELYRAQDFPDAYIIDPEFNGKTLSKEAQTRGAGNAVNPCIARALVAANVRLAA